MKFQWMCGGLRYMHFSERSNVPTLQSAAEWDYQVMCYQSTCLAQKYRVQVQIWKPTLTLPPLYRRLPPTSRK